MLAIADAHKTYCNTYQSSPSTHPCSNFFHQLKMYLSVKSTPHLYIHQQADCLCSTQMASSIAKSSLIIVSLSFCSKCNGHVDVVDKVSICSDMFDSYQLHSAIHICVNVRSHVNTTADVWFCLSYILVMALGSEAWYSTYSMWYHQYKQMLHDKNVNQVNKYSCHAIQQNL